MWSGRQNFNRDDQKFKNKQTKKKKHSYKVRNFKKKKKDKYQRQAKVLNKFGYYWEFMKFEIRNFAFMLSKKISKQHKESEIQIITKITVLLEKNQA